MFYDLHGQQEPLQIQTPETETAGALPHGPEVLLLLMLAGPRRRGDAKTITSS